jgi:hypothetical protein
MAFDATARRRWFGGVVLLAALAMVVGGETVLRDRLSPLATLIYWLLCMVFTGLAVVVALLDVRALQRRTQQEQRALFEATLKKIHTEAETRSQPPPPPPRGQRR